MAISFFVLFEFGIIIIFASLLLYLFGPGKPIHHCVIYIYPIFWRHPLKSKQQTCSP